MVLYVCPVGTRGGSIPRLHPCGWAAKALDDAGHTYEVKSVRGATGMFWTWSSRGRDRAEVERLSGQRSVPILVLDDGEVVTGSAKIVEWAHAHAPGEETHA